MILGVCVNLRFLVSFWLRVWSGKLSPRYAISLCLWCKGGFDLAIEFTIFLFSQVNCRAQNQKLKSSHMGEPIEIEGLE